MGKDIMFLQGNKKPKLKNINNNRNILPTYVVIRFESHLVTYRPLQDANYYQSFLLLPSLFNKNSFKLYPKLNYLVTIKLVQLLFRLTTAPASLQQFLINLITGNQVHLRSDRPQYLSVTFLRDFLLFRGVTCFDFNENNCYRNEMYVLKI